MPIATDLPRDTPRHRTGGRPCRPYRPRMTTIAAPTDRQRDAAEQARALEDDARHYPEDRVQCLLEAAVAWRAAGDPERAITLLDEWPSWPDQVDAGLARVDIAESLWALGRAAEAEQVMADLRATRPPASVCNAAAELCEERESWDKALGWFSLAVHQLSAAELAAVQSGQAWFSDAQMVLQGRQRVRARLRMAPDELDRSVPDVSELLQRRLPTYEELVDGPAASMLAGRTARMLFWPRHELPSAQQRWPEVYGGDPSGYHARLEHKLRDLAERTGHAVSLVASRVEPLTRHVAETGGDVADESTRQAFFDAQVAAGDVCVWPPARNAPCWCESGAKYKKCCARA